MPKPKQILPLPARNRRLPEGLQAKFSMDGFSTGIEAHGLDYQWYRALVCPCTLSAETDGYDPNCERCVDGWLYVNPNAFIERQSTRKYTIIKAILSSVRLNPKTGEYESSPWTTGRATLTVDGQFPISYHDKFISLDQRTTMSQVLKRLNQSEIPVGWLGRNPEIQIGSMRYEPITVNMAQDEDGVTYYPNVDYTMLDAVNENPVRMAWLAGRGPAVGKRFSVSYDAHPVWVVDDETYAIQNSVGPQSGQGFAGTEGLQYLPTTYIVRLDWIPVKQGA